MVGPLLPSEGGGWWYPLWGKSTKWLDGKAPPRIPTRCAVQPTVKWMASFSISKPPTQERTRPTPQSVVKEGPARETIRQLQLTTYTEETFVEKRKCVRATGSQINQGMDWGDRSRGYFTKEFRSF